LKSYRRILYHGVEAFLVCPLPPARMMHEERNPLDSCLAAQGNARVVAYTIADIGETFPDPSTASKP
jgi:hypothetical protein